MKQPNDKFKFFIPIDEDNITFAKAVTKGGKEEEVMFVEGCASTADKDLDGEMLLPEGFNLDYFKSSGFVNWGHHTDPSHYIGEPVEAYVAKGKFFVKAKLFAWSDLAKGVYQLAQNLAKGSTRKLGWSIEGKAVEKDPINKKIIRKAIITGVAITPMPKNGQTYLDIVKGMNNGFDFELSEDIDFDVIDTENPLIIDFTKGDKNFKVDKDFNVFVNGVKAISKGMETSSPSSRAIMRESVEKKLTNLSSNIKKSVEETLVAMSIIQKGYEIGMIDDAEFNRLLKRIDILSK